MSPVSCLISCLWSRFSKQSASGQPQQPTDPVRSAEQRRAEQSQSTRSKVTATRPLGHCQRVAGLNSQLGLQVWGARLQSQFNEIRINRPLESISLPLPPTPRLTLSPHLWSQPPFFLLFLFLLLLSLLTTPSRQLASGCAALYMQTDRP